MANQQLVDYINAQRAKGVARDAINAALLGAGWSAADVGQAMDTAFSPSPAAATAGATSPASSTFFKPTQSSQPTAGPVSFQARPVSTVSPLNTSRPVEPVVTTEEHHLSKPLVAGVIVVVLLAIGGLAYWYFGGEPGAPTPATGSGEQSAVDQLTKTNADLQAQAGQMTAQIADLENQLSIFASGTTQEAPLTIRGTIQQATTTKIFTLTTNRNITVVVANSKDAKVVAALTTLIGASAELQGTHPSASAQLTVTHVNSTPLATAPAATGTTTGATTTGTTSAQ